jgi:hypothetical protein
MSYSRFLSREVFFAFVRRRRDASARVTASAFLRLFRRFFVRDGAIVRHDLLALI